MSHGRIYPLFLLAAGLALSARLEAQQAQPKAPAPVLPGPRSTLAPPTVPPPATPPATPPKPTTPAPEAVKTDPEATRILDEAVKAFEKSPIQWLKAELWQQMDVQGLVVQCDGVYLYGPNYKLRLDLNLRAGGEANRLTIVCDGNTRWEVRELGPSKKEVQRMDWSRVVKTLSQPGVDAQEREQFLSSLAFSGLLPLLKSLRQDLALTRQEKVRWNDRDVVKLTGVWDGKIVPTPVPAAQWPAALPRQCCLYLDAKTSFPYRVEWWGPSSPGMADSTLLQLEFKNPTVNVELSADRVAQVFKFQPGDAAVQDVTEQLVGALQSNFDRRRTQPRAK